MSVLVLCNINAYLSSERFCKRLKVPREENTAFSHQSVPAPGILTGCAHFAPGLIVNFSAWEIVVHLLS